VASFVQGEARAIHLVIPDTLPFGGSGRQMFGGVKNETLEEAYVSLLLYSSDGTLLDEGIEVLLPKETLTIRPGSYPFYSMPQEGWIEIVGDGDQTLSGYQYLRDAGGTETIFALPVRSTRKIVPHVAPPNGWWIETLILVNPNDQRNLVSFYPSRTGEDTGGDLSLELGPREKRVIELQDLFSAYPQRSILEIRGEHPFVGYYTYTPRSGGDEASYPLLDEADLKPELTLTHYAGRGGYWWTGICVSNPSSFAVTVRVEPYDDDGNLMDGSVEYLDLDAGGCEVFAVRPFFGEATSEISFINLTTEEAQAPIGGFFMYGNMSDGKRMADMLTGANM
jgi:hypothetical protein